MNTDTSPIVLSATLRCISKHSLRSPFERPSELPHLHVVEFMGLTPLSDWHDGAADLLRKAKVRLDELPDPPSELVFRIDLMLRSGEEEVMLPVRFISALANAGVALELACAFAENRGTGQ